MTPELNIVQFIADSLNNSEVVAVHVDRMHIRRLSREEGIIKKVRSISHAPFFVIALQMVLLDCCTHYYFL